ncbi:MAG: class II aldolase/adducin family protein [Oscillospiraceae bacterium]|nr:class II aldolase/adducin family protein [Oscillospiraceae bacterium]
MDLTAIIRVSNKYGADPELVLAGGGNTSVKDHDTLYIKCSGAGLATIDENGFVPVGRALLDKTLTKQYPADDAGREAAFLQDVMAARSIPGETRRPSVEALLHHLFPQRYVVHLHPALINGLTCGKDGEHRLRELFGGSALWIPLTRPGLVLGKVCHQAMGKYYAETGQNAQLVFLENHGIFIAANTEQEISEILEGAVAKLKSAVVQHPDTQYSHIPDPAALAEVVRKTGASHIAFRASPMLLKMLQSQETANDLMQPFSPDQIVYCGVRPIYVSSPGEIEPGELHRKVLLVQGVGAFALGQSEKEAETAALLFIDAVKIAVYARSFGGPQPLDDDMIQFIVSWEAESYRQKEAKR